MAKSKTKQLRIDKKKRFPLRISETTHAEIETECFNGNLSLNLYYVEAIEFAKDNPSFLSYMEEKYKRDLRRGHFKFFHDTTTLSRGKLVTSK